MDCENDNQVDSSKSQGRSLSRAELIAAINQEIKDIDDETKRPGWSRWALLAASGTLVWLLLGEISSKANPETIGSVFLFGSLVVECLATLFTFLKRLSHPPEQQERYRSLAENPDANLAIVVFQLFRFGFLLLLSCSLVNARNVPTLSTFFGVNATALIMIGLIRQLKVPALHSDVHSRMGRICYLILITWSGFLSVRLFQQLPLFDGEYRVADFKLGALMLGMMYLLWLLVTEEKERPSVLVLRKIRRGLAFEELSVEHAAKEVDVVISGWKSIDVLDRKLNNLSDSLQQLTATNQKILTNCIAANLILDRLETPRSDWKPTARKVALLIDSCVTESTDQKEATKLAFANWKGSIRAFNKMLGRRPELESQFAGKRQKVAQQLDAFVGSLASSEKSVTEIQTRYQIIRESNLCDPTDTDGSPIEAG